MRRWFIKQESELFRYRFCLERVSNRSNDIVEDFLKSNNLHFSHLSAVEENKLHDKLLAGTTNFNNQTESSTFYKASSMLDLNLCY